MKTWNVEKTLKLSFVLAGMVFAFSGRAVRAGTAEAAGPWDASKADAFAFKDSPVWGQPATNYRPDPLLGDLLRSRPQSKAMLPEGNPLSQAYDPAALGAKAPWEKVGYLVGFTPHTGISTVRAALSSGERRPPGAAAKNATRAIPVPSAVALFPSGAALAAYATWRSGRRRRVPVAVRVRTSRLIAG